MDTLLIQIRAIWMGLNLKKMGILKAGGVILMMQKQEMDLVIRIECFFGCFKPLKMQIRMMKTVLPGFNNAFDSS